MLDDAHDESDETLTLLNASDFAIGFLSQFAQPMRMGAAGGGPMGAGSMAMGSNAAHRAQREYRFLVLGEGRAGGRRAGSRGLGGAH